MRAHFGGAEGSTTTLGDRQLQQVRGTPPCRVDVAATRVGIGGIDREPALPA
jgi:hypothetical protein